MKANWQQVRMQRDEASLGEAGISERPRFFLLLLTEGAVAVISIHPVLTGPAVKTGVTLTVIDDGVTRFAWIHRTTQIKMDEVKDGMGGWGWGVGGDRTLEPSGPDARVRPSSSRTAKTLLESD